MAYLECDALPTLEVASLYALSTPTALFPLHISESPSCVRPVLWCVVSRRTLYTQGITLHTACNAGW